MKAKQTGKPLGLSAKHWRDQGQMKGPNLLRQQKPKRERKREEAWRAEIAGVGANKKPHFRKTGRGPEHADSLKKGDAE